MQKDINFHFVPLTVDFDAEWDPGYNYWKFTFYSAKVGKIDILSLLSNLQIEDIEEILSQELNEQKDDKNKSLRLEKENKQMRKALEKIANVGSWKKDINGIWHIGNKPVFQVAKDGLKGVKNV